MHPAFSVIFLTTLIGAGQGLFLALYTGQIYSVFNVFPEQDSHNFYGIGSLIAVLFLVTGLIASMFHLGHPERAWRSAAMWRTSWLSREVIALPAFISMTIAYGSIHYFDLNPILFNIGDSLIIDLSLLIGVSMVLNMIVAGLFGILVPVSLKKLNIDLALASSVFVTTITDVIGFLSFLGLGSYYFLN